MKKVNQYFNKYFDLKWLFGYKTPMEKFKKIGFIILFLILIGLLRLMLEVLYGINLNGKWYSFDRDIIFVMSVFPFYLCFFLAMCTDLILKLLKVKVDFKKVFWIFFVLQIFHAFIPFFDYIGFVSGIPWTFQPYMNMGSCQIGPFSNVSNIYQVIIVLTPLLIFFTHPELITMGINIILILTSFIFANFLIKELKISVFKTLLTIFILFHIIYWPIYKYFFVFDFLFGMISGMTEYNHYGYGIYFLVFGTIGLIYFFRRVKWFGKNMKKK